MKSILGLEFYSSSLALCTNTGSRHSVSPTFFIQSSTLNHFIGIIGLDVIQQHNTRLSSLPFHPFFFNHFFHKTLSSQNVSKPSLFPFQYKCLKYTLSLSYLASVQVSDPYNTRLQTIVVITFFFRSLHTLFKRSSLLLWNAFLTLQFCT